MIYMGCGIRCEMGCGIGYDMGCGIRCEMSCGIGYDMGCGIRCEMGCGIGYDIYGLWYKMSNGLWYCL
jgi:hypothetical protein